MKCITLLPIASGVNITARRATATGRRHFGNQVGGRDLEFKYLGVGKQAEEEC